MLSLEDKFNILKWLLIILSVATGISVGVFRITKKGIPLFFKITALFSFVGAIALVDMYWIDPNWIAVEEATIHDPGLAEVLQGMKVVQISDIHMRGGGGYREKRLVEKVNALKPDLLFITGDYFSDEQKTELPQETEALAKLIRGFRTTSGIFGIEGNYDGPLRDPAVKRAFEASGIDILRFESRSVPLTNNKRLHLFGLKCACSKCADMITLENIAGKAPTILLAHDPDAFDYAARAGVNLALVGHTHGGQIGIPFLVRNSHSANKSPYMSGLYEKGETKMYVNRGIGTTHLPVRLLCRPEITIFRFSNVQR